MKSPIFVFGYPRSGTTLLRSVLSQHSQVNTLVHEPEIVIALRHAGYDTQSVFSWNDRSKLLDELRQIGLCRKHLERLPKWVLFDFTNCKRDLSFIEVYERLLPRPQEDNIIWGEKRLNNLFFVQDLVNMYPNAIFIHIVRDPRSAILSHFIKRRRKGYAQVTDKGTASRIDWLRNAMYFAKESMLWESWMQVARSSVRLVPSQCWIEIRYEDFIQRAKESLQMVCESIGIPFEHAMLDAEARRSDPVLSYANGAYGHAKIAQDFDKSRALAYEIHRLH